MLKFNEFKIKNEVEIKNNGIEIVFEPSTETYEKYQEYKEMTQKTYLNAFNVKDIVGDVNDKDFLSKNNIDSDKLMENLDMDKVLELMNSEENLKILREMVLTIPDLTEENINEHFDNCSNVKAICENLKHNFYDYAGSKIIEFFEKDCKELEGK